MTPHKIGALEDFETRLEFEMLLADMGSFGSEIKTPNLDPLAKDSVRFTFFYTHASCSPTRSLLLSGVATHLNGLGNMDEWTAPNQVGVDGYKSTVNNGAPGDLRMDRFWSRSCMDGTLSWKARNG